MKTTIIYLFTIFSLGFLNLPTTFAQRQVKQYYKNDGSQVRREKNADFVRVFQKEQQDSYYTMTEYYADQQIKRTGKVADLAPHFCLKARSLHITPMEIND